MCRAQDLLSWMSVCVCVTVCLARAQDLLSWMSVCVCVCVTVCLARAQDLLSCMSRTGTMSSVCDGVFGPAGCVARRTC